MIEPGSDAIELAPGNYQITRRGEIVTLEAWSETQNVVRRLRSIAAEQRGRLEIEVERFGGRAGRIVLADLAHPANRDASRRGVRLKYRERFRHSLLRQFPDLKLIELSTEPDLQHSLSPSYPRAFLRKGNIGLAAIGAAEDALDPDGALTFGLIWLDYLRRREPRTAIRGLAIFLPEEREATTCHRLRYLDPSIASYSIFVHHPDGSEDPVEPGDYTNFSTKIEACRQALAGSRAELHEWVGRLAAIEGVQRRDQPDGSVSLALRGIEFARASGELLLFGALPLGQAHRHAANEASVPEIVALAEGLAEIRHAGAANPCNPLYSRYPEAWLESEVRGNIEEIDARLLPCPVYGQVPQFAGGERGIIDLLALERGGRLAVIEIKASQDVHLPLQALDYWMRVKWHLERGEFSGRGYFPGMQLRSDPPILLLVAPALDFHPSNETVLRYLSPEVPAERIGVGIQWRQELRVMFRGSARKCSPFNATSSRRSQT
ncbi:MAG: hypothetical protein JO062_24415 [Bryobacterales bacterium]|nr:hypothetical protein [Bryobacterales bacterium]